MSVTSWGTPPAVKSMLSQKSPKLPQQPEQKWDNDRILQLRNCKDQGKDILKKL